MHFQRHAETHAHDNNDNIMFFSHLVLLFFAPTIARTVALAQRHADFMRLQFS